MRFLSNPEAVIDDEVGTPVVKPHDLFDLADVAVTSRDFESGDVRHPSSGGWSGRTDDFDGHHPYLCCHCAHLHRVVDLRTGNSGAYADGGPSKSRDHCRSG
jgi:hypothetical protein